MIRIISLTASALITALLLGMAASCGGRIHKAPVKGLVPLEPKAYTLQDSLTELDALERPEGVDEKVWDELKGALREALECRAVINDGSAAVPAVNNNSEVGGRDTRPTDKIVSTPPSGSANKVNDLTATRETNGDFTLSWHYRNLGDYDQNGVVGVSDITPLAMHYNETYDPETEPDCIQAVIDGSGNGKVGVEDVTQLAQYFGNEFAVYEMQGSDQQQGPFAHTNTVQPPAEGRSDARLAFTFGLSSQPPYTYWRVVPLDSDNNPGEASNVVALNVEAPVRVLGVTPLSGLAGSDVTFTAFVAGTGPFTFEWNFGDGATPNISTAAQPTVTLSMSEGPHPAQVKVTGATGSVTYHFTLTVTPTPGNPPVINSVGPFSGMSGEQLNFSADVTGDEPLTYSWEFDGGASPPVSAEAAPTAILSRGGTLPEPAKGYPCRLTVTNDFGAAVQDFTLTVSAWWHVEEIPYVPFRTNSPVMSPRFSLDGVLCGASSYKDDNGDRIVAYERLEEGSWTVEQAALGRPDYSGMGFGFDSRGNPAISWGDYNDGAIHFAAKRGGEWQHEVVAPCGPPNGLIAPSTELSFTAQDRAVIAYSYFSAVGVARETAGGWEILEPPRGPVALLPDGRVAVANNEDDQNRAMLFKETDSGWESTLIVEASESDVAYPGCLAIDSAGKAHVIVGGSFLGLNVAREQANGSFVLDPISRPVEGITWDIRLLLTHSDEELVLFTAKDVQGQMSVLAWREPAGWQYLDCSIERGTELLIHPSGYPAVVSQTQMAAYW